MVHHLSVNLIKKKLTEKLQRQKDNERDIVGVLIDKKWLKAT